MRSKVNRSRGLRSAAFAAWLAGPAR